MLKYIGPIIVVEDIARSRHFYEHLLGQKVMFDFGVNISFDGGYAVHQKAHFQSLLGDESQYPIVKKAHNGDLVFETDALETLYQTLKQAAVEFIHEIQEQPWGQRVMRLYDPDGHVLEIGETMEASVWRLYSQGLSIERVREITAMPMEFVERAIQEYRKASQVNTG
jgi:catechol 2,3-dioxygenase-like lactoylglutathione lyase family enzyme